MLIIVALSLIIYSGCNHKNDKLNAKNYSANGNKKESSDSTEPFIIILEEMPIFPGGEKALIQFISNNINYPPSAIQDSIEGKVFLKFVVKADGSVNNVNVIKSLRYDLDNECIRVLEMLPRFQPGKMEGKPVPVWYAIPITFTLKKNEESKGVLISPKNENHLQTMKIKLYPNPAKEFIKIELSELPINIEYNIISLNGQILKTGSINDYAQTIFIQDLIDGMYIINLKTDRSIIQSQKFIVKK